jgi:glycosyltransferase involved in cell wall biosynthesis
VRVWLLKISEPLPIGNGAGDRLFRIGLLAQHLSRQGHEVMWWANTFDHARKEFRFPKSQSVQVSERLLIRCLHSVPYKKNISWKRMRHHSETAFQFSREAADLPAPDVILSCLPTPELCYSAANICVARTIPFIVDVRDLWPDDIIRALPKIVRPIASIFLSRMRKRVSFACRSASALFGVTEGYLDWGLKMAKRARTSTDQVVPLMADSEEPSAEEQKRALEFWSRFGISKQKGDLIVCFFGVISWSAQMEPVIAAARILASTHPKIKFVLCGMGDRLEEFKQMSSDCSNVIWPGWVGKAEIWTLMRASTLGLTVYPSTENFKANIPNKIPEYLSAGLPILSSLEGRVAKILSSANAGVTYENLNVTSLIDSIVALSENPSRAGEMGRNARSLYETDFSAGGILAGFENAILKVIDTGRTKLC